MTRWIRLSQLQHTKIKIERTVCTYVVKIVLYKAGQSWFSNVFNWIQLSPKRQFWENNPKEQFTRRYSDSWKYSICDEQCIPGVVLGLCTILCYSLSFNLPCLNWIQLVISYISQGAFQQPAQKRAVSLNGTVVFNCCMYVGYLYVEIKWHKIM